MKENPKIFFTTDFTDSTDGIPAVPYLCYPCHPWLNIFVLVLGVMVFSAHAQIQQAWDARYNNGITNGTNQAVKMVLDSAGNIYITGFSKSTNGNLDYATIKYAPNGAELWAARYVATNANSAMPAGMTLDASNNVIVTGSAITVKYDSNGNQLWTAPYAGASVAVDAAADVYVTGFGTNFNTEKLSPNGSNVWQVTYKDVGPTLSQVVLVDSQTNIYVAGSDVWIYYGEDPEAPPAGYYSRVAVVKWDVNGHQKWEATYYDVDATYCEIAGSALDGTNNLYIGSKNVFNTEYEGGSITLMYSNNGVLAWCNGEGDLSFGLALDASDNVFVTGQASYLLQGGNIYFGPYIDGYGTYKMSTNGSELWSNYYPMVQAQPSAGLAIVVDLANNVYVTGYSPGANSSNNIVTIKYDNNGNQIWLQSYSSPGGGDAAANAIAVDGYGNVYVAGYDTTPAGGTEMVLIKYAPTLSGSLQTNGAFLLQTTGEPGETIDVQSSTNLSNWLDLGTITADTNGNLQFLDTNAPLFNQRFYLTKPQ